MGTSRYGSRDKWLALFRTLVREKLARPDYQVVWDDAIYLYSVGHSPEVAADLYISAHVLTPSDKE